MLNFQDLPNELVLKVLSYSETKDLISCGQVSKRIRRISHDDTLWVTANIENKIVKTELLEMVLGKGCMILDLRYSTILGRLSSNTKSQLRVLKLSLSACDIHCEPDCDENNGVLEELLSSCCSLQHLVMEGVFLTPKMAVSICKNGKTLQTLNLSSSYLESLAYDNLDGSPTDSYLLEIFKCCQELKEVDLSYIDDNQGLTDENLEFLAKNISPNLEKLNLCSSSVRDDYIKILLRRCNKIKTLTLGKRGTDNSFSWTRGHSMTKWTMTKWGWLK